MRYGHQFAEVESEGLGETRGFSIATSGKAFRSLIDSIYSQKIEAPIRELATNAFDGHLAVGKIEPFDVHLPTPLDPTFFVRDYGCSMTHEMVMNRYTTLFDSTKDGAHDADVVVIAPNKQVGSWGLGSKTPFTITDAFTLTCWLDGEVRIYSIFIGSNGQPQCALAHRGESNEPTGVKVEFPVNNDDIEDFAKAAIKVFKGFNILPNGLSLAVLKELQIEPTQIGSFWKAFPSDYLGKGFFARQGCVIYPIDLDKIGEAAKDFNAVNLSVVIDFPIGAIEYTNSREFLAYTSETIEALNTRFGEFRSEVEKEARTALSTIRNRFARASAIGDNDLFKMNRFAFLTETSKDRDHIAKVFDTFIAYSARDYKYRPENNDALYAVDKNGDKARYRQFTFAGGHFPDRVALIYIDELTRNGTPRLTGVSERVSKWIRENNLRYAYVFKDIPKLSKLRDAGFPPITRISAIPALPKKVRDPSDYVGGGFTRFKRQGLEIDESEIPDDALFVLINRGTWLNADGSVMSRDDKETCNTVLEFLDRPLIEINTRSNEKLDRWADRDMLYSHSLDDIFDTLTDQQIKALIATLNHRRFEMTELSRVVDSLRSADVLQRTPFASLNRFTLAYQRARGTMKEFIDLCDGILRADGNTYLHTVIERGRHLGLEVLCPPVRDKHWRMQHYEPKLLPKNVQQFYNLVKSNKLNLEELTYIVKEIFE